MKLLSIFFTLSVAVLLTSALMAGEKKRKTSGIVPEGSASVGLSTFIDRGCYKCHVAGNTKLPKLEVARKLGIQLGGDEHRNWTRDDFAQAIMNPNHTIAPEYQIAKIVSGDKFGAENSPMLDFNKILTLKEMINITTFLVSLQK